MSDRTLKPDYPCRFEEGDTVDLLDALRRTYGKQGKVTACSWSGDGSDIGWWLDVDCGDGKRYVCHSGDIKKVERVDK